MKNSVATYLNLIDESNNNNIGETNKILYEANIRMFSLTQKYFSSDYAFLHFC